MIELELRIKLENLDFKIGKLVWQVGPGGTPDYDIPKLVEVDSDKETFATLSGLQYYDYGCFVLLMTVYSPVEGTRFFLLDTEEVDYRSSSPHYLSEIGGLKEFSSIARNYIDSLY